MATLLAKIQIHAGKEALFEDVMAFMYRQTHDTEDSVVRYEYWRGQKPGFYYCLLSFTDSLAFWRHQASDHHEGQMERFVQCIDDLELEVIDPVTEASPLPATQAMTCPQHTQSDIEAQSKIYPIALQPWWEALRAAT